MESKYWKKHKDSLPLFICFCFFFYVDKYTEFMVFVVAMAKSDETFDVYENWMYCRRIFHRKCLNQSFSHIFIIYW